MKGIVNKSILASLAVAFALVCGWLLLPGSSFAGEDTALEVYQDNALAKAFTENEIKALGTETHTYSAFNSYPSPQIAKNVEGVTLTAILRASGIDPGSIGPKQVIEVTAGDGVKELFLKEQLFAERYYFPKVRNEAGRNGKKPLASSWEGKAIVPAVISLKEPEGSVDDVGRLLFGQTAPTEQNYSAFLKYMLDKGRITVRSAEGGRWNALQKADPIGGSRVKTGTEITFDRSVNRDPGIVSERYCVYYTMDGSEPTLGSDLYNYNNFNFGSIYEKFNKPVISKTGPVTIRTKVIGYGLQDSAVTAFSYTGYVPAPATTAPKRTVTTTAAPKAPAVPKIKKIKAKKKALVLKWTRVRDAGGYKIYRATKKKGKYKLVKTIKRNSTLTWTNKKLKKKKTYYYKIRAFKVASGKVIYSRYSAVKHKKTK